MLVILGLPSAVSSAGGFKLYRRSAQELMTRPNMRNAAMIWLPMGNQTYFVVQCKMNKMVAHLMDNDKAVIYHTRNNV